MNKLLILILSLSLLGGVLSIGLLWGTAIPLGVPGEWEWPRQDWTPDVPANLAVGMSVGLGYLAVVLCGWRRFRRDSCRSWESGLWLCGLMLAASVWVWHAQGTGTTGATIGRWPYILYYPASSGYFFRARYQSPPPREFLRNYEALMQEGDVLHTGTHPPGLFLFFHGLIEVTRRSPDLARALNETQPTVVKEGFDQIRLQPLLGTPSITLTDRAAIWLAGLICFGLAILTIGPLYGFLRQDLDRPTSWVIAATWPLIPAIAVFLPKSDVAYAGLAMTVIWCWRMAWNRGGFYWSVTAGLVWTLGLLCSLAFLPVGLWLAVWWLVQWRLARKTENSSVFLLRGLKITLPAAVASILLLVLLSQWGQVSLLNIFWLNYQNHAGFYAQFPRTWLAWLAVNPLELALAVGLPVMVLAVTGIWQSLCGKTPDSDRRWWPSCIATLVVWSWLWLSGKNSGEAARLWIFLMPLLVSQAAGAWNSLLREPVVPAVSWSVAGWFLLQMLVCLLTVQRINGFPMPLN